MSTYWYFECLAHDPPLRSDGEITQHTEDSAYWDAVKMASQRPLPVPEWGYPSARGGYFDDNARQFLFSHQTCKLNLISEYGERRPLDTSEVQMWDRLIEVTQKQLRDLRKWRKSAERDAAKEAKARGDA